MSYGEDIFYMANDIEEFKNNNMFKKYPGDAGWDIRSGQKILIPPQTSARIETGLHVCIPFGLKMPLKTKSRFTRLKVEVGNVVVDHGYTGAIEIPVHNHHPNEPLRINKGDFIAQAVFTLAFTRPLSELLNLVAPEVFSEVPVVAWPDSVGDRGDQGFGHTKQYEPLLVGQAGVASVA